MSKIFCTLVVTTLILEFAKFDEEYSFKCDSRCEVMCDDGSYKTPYICRGCDNNMGMKKLGHDFLGRSEYL